MFYLMSQHPIDTIEKALGFPLSSLKDSNVTLINFAPTIYSKNEQGASVPIAVLDRLLALVVTSVTCNVNIEEDTPVVRMELKSEAAYCNILVESMETSEKTEIYVGDIALWFPPSLAGGFQGQLEILCSDRLGGEAHLSFSGIRL